MMFAEKSNDGADEKICSVMEWTAENFDPVDTCILIQLQRIEKLLYAFLAGN